jgi:hypothetical protein
LKDGIDRKKDQKGFKKVPILLIKYLRFRKRIAMNFLWPSFDIITVIVLIGVFRWMWYKVSHIERQIIIAFIGIGIAMFIPRYHSGFWKGLGITLLQELGFVGFLAVLIVTLMGIGSLGELLYIKISKISSQEALEKGRKAGEEWSGGKTAIRWLRKAARMGNADAQDRLGFLYAIGKGIQQDSMKARYWFKKAADQGHAEAGEHFRKLQAGETITD